MTESLVATVFLLLMIFAGHWLTRVEPPPSVVQRHGNTWTFTTAHDYASIIVTAFCTDGQTGEIIAGDPDPYILTRPQDAAP